MGGKGLTKEQRQQNMCAGAKVCTGKAKNIDEGKKICAALPPKEPKARKTGKRGGGDSGGCCIGDVPATVDCIMEELEAYEELDDDNMAEALSKAILACACGKKAKKIKAPSDKEEEEE